MNRTITYPGALPKSADFLNAQRNAMISAGAILQAVFGTGAVASGFTCSALAVPGMGVQVSAGALTQYTTVDATAYGEIAADLTEFIVKQGINLDATTLNVAAPTTAGQSIAYLIEATFAETDGTPVVLPYVNAANPSQPYAGPTNSGVAQNTTRNQTVTLVAKAKAGAAAAAGSQVPPAADSGYVPLFVVTVAYGQSAVTIANIAQHPSAPFPPYTLQELSPGFSNEQVFTSSATWTAPAGVTKVKLRLWGGGGSGAGGSSSLGGGGGAGGGYAEGVFSVTPGTTYQVTVAGQTAGGAASSNGTSGGTSSFGSPVSATGGAYGIYSSGQTTCGNGVGGAFNVPGFPGLGPYSTLGGYGGSAYGAEGGRPSNQTGNGGSFPGGGGSGAYGALVGGTGAAGLVIVAW